MRLVPPAAPPGWTECTLPPKPGRGSGAELWLVRHAAVDPEQAKYAYGNADVPLAPEGLERSAELARAFAERPIQRVLSSPLERALRLGRAIAHESRAELLVDARLGELWRGRWQGLPLAEYQALWNAAGASYWANPMRWKGHAGESEEELRERVWQALEEHVRGPGRFVLTIHYQVLRALIASALGLGAAGSHALENDVGHACLLVDAPGGWTLVQSNVRTPYARPLGGTRA